LRRPKDSSSSPRFQRTCHKEENMTIIDNDDPFTRKGLRKFMRGYFYTDWADSDPADVDASIDEYLTAETADDPTGEVLLKELNELISRNLTNEQLIELIERDWNVRVNSEAAGFTYTETLPRISYYLSAKVQEQKKKRQ